MLPTPSHPHVSNLFCISESPNRNYIFKFSQHGPLYGINYPSVRVPKFVSLEDLGLRNIHKLEAFKGELYSKWVDGYFKGGYLQYTRYKIQDVYLGISSYPGWVVYRKMPEQVLLKSIKVCKYK